MNQAEAIAFLEQFVHTQYAPEQQQAFLTWLREADEEAIMHVAMAYEDMVHASAVATQPDERLVALIEKRLDAADGLQTAPRIPLYRRAWLRYAAAIFILLGIGTYVWFAQNHKPSQVQPVVVKKDKAPGGNKAVLTLADGSRIMLDSAANGHLSQQEGVVIDKQGAVLSYSHDGKVATEAPVRYNTLSTPRGGQYQLSLPDGTKVWLNAASSITYPTVFTGTQRKVEVQGEAYFEVTKNEKMPFIVYVNNKAEIEVLGTEFNVNAYADEASISTTLLLGSVRVQSNNAGTILKPGQQAQLQASRTGITIQQPDLDQVTAWKQGYFNFNKLALSDAMRQIARWYDVEIIYDDNIPPILFYGEVQRDLSLNQVLNVLSGMGVRFELQAGNKLHLSKS